MLMCLECGGIAYKNSYFGVVTCQSCGWRVSIKEYEELENQRKEVNTMAKAILELEMPESCTECMFKECLNRTTSVEVSRCIILHKMHVPGSYCPAEGRHPDCPLKPVEKGGGEMN